MSSAPSMVRATTDPRGSDTERARRAANRARYDNVQFFSRVGVAILLGVAALFVPGVGDDRGLVSLFMLGLAAPAHFLVRWCAKVPNPTGWLDALAIASASAVMMIEPDVWTPSLVFQMLTIGSALAYLQLRWVVAMAAVSAAGMVSVIVVHRPPDGLTTLITVAAMLPVVVMGARRKYTRDRRARTQMRFTLESLPLLVWEADVDTGALISIAGSPEALTGRTLGEVRQRIEVDRGIGLIHPDDRASVAGRLRPDHPDQHIKEIDYRLFATDGRILWIHDRILFTRSGGRALARGITFDITTSKEQELRILEQANHDHLTGLPNRGALLDALGAMLDGSRELGLLLVDLNEFKEINDTLGHLSGDDFLRALGRRLGALATEHDVLVARLGGDEFAFVVADRPPDAIDEVARLVWETCRQPVELLGSAIACGASVGIALAPHDANTAEELLRRADLAMYRAKRSHAGTWRYDLSLDRSADEVGLLGELPRAFDRGEIEMFLQPMVDLRTGAVTGAEALARWRHPERGVLTPNVFLDLVSVGGLSGELARTALRQAAAALAMTPEPFTIAVNLTAQNVRDPELVDDIRRILSVAGVDAHRLTLEITEAHVLDASGAVLENLDRLARAGISIAVDDFGTGYSSLTHLRSLPISQLKIDRQFVTSMLEREQDHVIVRSMINLAHDLGVEVTAEGIETAAVADRLRELGCDHGQGYLWGRPAPVGGPVDRADRVIPDAVPVAGVGEAQPAAAKP